MVMETEEFHNLLFASWRSRKSSGMIESKSKGTIGGVEGGAMV